ncbi:MAG: GntR family transcriptional regulator [Verrucomicrobiae bacterium]|nr:GntR family transcriptional regulator [Verrucomicrobiae bacterium]
MNLELKVQSPARVHEQIECFLREQILAGELKVGEQLPATHVLARRWRVDHTAIQKAMTQLVERGLIVRRRRLGTFVNPARCAIAVLTGPSLTDETAHFHRAVVKCLQMEIAGSKDDCWECRVYGGVTEPQTGGDFSPAFVCRQFLNDLRYYSFKGIVQLAGTLNEQSFSGEESQKLERLPVARMASQVRQTGADVALDFYRFTKESVCFAAEHGFGKVAYLRTLYDSAATARDLDGLHDAVKSLGLPKAQVCQLEEVWMTGCQLERMAYEKTLKLVDAWRTEKSWPETLLVSDDIAARGVALALVRRGVEVVMIGEKRGAVHADGTDLPEKFGLITAANETVEHHYGLPVTRYEFSPQTVARELIRVLRDQLSGKTSSRQSPGSLGEGWISGKIKI